MSYTAADPGKFLGQIVGNGHCVAYVRKAAGTPATAAWKEGAKVKGKNVAAGVAIATFQGGKYQNATDGRSHAAIFISQNATGLWVYDQWLGQPVHKRMIRFKGGKGTANNDGDAFSVIG